MNEFHKIKRLSQKIFWWSEDEIMPNQNNSRKTVSGWSWIFWLVSYGFPFWFAVLGYFYDFLYQIGFHPKPAPHPFQMASDALLEAGANHGWFKIGRMIITICENNGYSTKWPIVRYRIRLCWNRIVVFKILATYALYGIIQLLFWAIQAYLAYVLFFIILF